MSRLFLLDMPFLERKVGAWGMKPTSTRSTQLDGRRFPLPAASAAT